MANNQALQHVNDESQIVGRETVALEVMQGGYMGLMARSEVEAQLDAAHKYPRSPKKFLDEAMTLATHSEDIAKSCMYTLPRSDKPISGPSVRLAEICISAWGNLHVGARVIGVEDTEIISQGICWDLEKNIRVTVEKRRRITNKRGERFNDDMITVTGNAAASIALRDAAFRVIPRTWVNVVYEAAKKVAIGEASTLSIRRDKVIDGLVKMGAMLDRILFKISKASVVDIGLAEMEWLIGWGTAIKTGEAQVDEIFPPIVREAGTVNVTDLKKGSEQNRGHGQDELQNLPKDQTKTDKKSEDKAAEDRKKEEAATAAAEKKRAAAALKEAEKKAAEAAQVTKSDAPPAADERVSGQIDEPDADTGPGPAEDDDGELLMSDEQFAILERERTENRVEVSDWIKWAKARFNIRMLKDLKRKNFAISLEWTKNGGKL